MDFNNYEFYNVITDIDYQTASEFLDKYYFQGDDINFKLHYSTDHIKWLVSVSEENHDHLCFALVFKGTKIFVGFIMGTVVQFSHNNEYINMTEVNLLCIHPKLRQKNYGLYVINEFVRRVKLIGHSEAIYTGVNKLSWPNVYIGTVNYYHRPLDLEYLINLDFTSVEPYKNIDAKKKALRLPNESKFLKELSEDKLSEAYKLFSNYIRKFKLYPIMSEEMFRKTFYNNNYVKCYLCIQDDIIKDIVSYYVMPFKHIETGKVVKSAMLYYYTNYNNNLYDWIKNLMINLVNDGYQLLNALNIMENDDILSSLKFEEGTGVLHYLIYKHKVDAIKANEIGKILF